MPGKKSCPHCRTQRLDVHHYQGEEVDSCHQCGGLWFEKGNLDRLIAERCVHTETADYVANLGAPLEPSRRQCPDCRQALQTFHLLPDFHLDIDVCRQCDGAWVEQEAVSKVVKSAAIRQALDEINGKTSWKTWVFQMLTRMPVEYNMQPRRTPWVTWALIVVNTLIFLSYGLDYQATGWVIEHFAIAPAEIQAGERWWTFVTATFLHGGFLHLIGNMYFLWLTGDNLEDALGHWKFLGLYLICGILAGAVSVLANLGSPIPSVGASGAIAGLFGMYLVWFPKASLTFMIVVWQVKLAVAWYFAIWLALNFFGMLIGEQGVDYWAHIGGFIVGLGLGYGMREKVWQWNPLLAYLAGPEVQVRR